MVFCIAVQHRKYVNFYSLSDIFTVNILNFVIVVVVVCKDCSCHYAFPRIEPGGRENCAPKLGHLPSAILNINGGT